MFLLEATLSTRAGSSHWGNSLLFLRTPLSKRELKSFSCTLTLGENFVEKALWGLSR